jgi:hypothetical protein
METQYVVCEVGHLFYMGMYLGFKGLLRQICVIS